LEAKSHPVVFVLGVEARAALLLYALNMATKELFVKLKLGKNMSGNKDLCQIGG